MASTAPDPEITPAALLSQIEAGELSAAGVVDRERRLIVSPRGRLVRVNYRLGPWSHQ